MRNIRATCAFEWEMKGGGETWKVYKIPIESVYSFIFKRERNLIVNKKKKGKLISFFASINLFISIIALKVIVYEWLKI